MTCNDFKQIWIFPLIFFFRKGSYIQKEKMEQFIRTKNMELVPSGGWVAQNEEEGLIMS